MSMNKICSLWTYYIFCLAGVLLISCTEDEVAETPFITVSKQELTFGKSGSETLLYIQSNVSYEVGFAGVVQHHPAGIGLKKDWQVFG